MNWKDIAERALSTMALTFLATFPAAAVADKDWATVFGVAAGAFGAGLSVIKNMVKQGLENRKANKGV